MQNIFKYAPWFKELSLRISEMSQEELFTKAKRVDWGDTDPVLLNYQYLGSGSVDPFSFLSYLAQRRHSSKRKNIFQSVHNGFGVATSLPNLDEQEETIFPGPSHGEMNFLFQQSTPETMQADEIWTLFRQVVRGQNHVQANDFEAIRSGKGSAISLRKLTSTLHLVNPYDFPVCLEVGFSPSEKWYSYRRFVREEKQKFPGCAPYEIYRTRFWCSKHWGKGKGDSRGFASKSVIHTVANYNEWRSIRDSQQFELQASAEPSKGEIVLFRLLGSSKALGIGAVYGDGFGTMRIDSGKVNVLWLSKKPRHLGKSNPSERDFREAYSETFEFIDEAINQSANVID